MNDNKTLAAMYDPAGGSFDAKEVYRDNEDFFQAIMAMSTPLDEDDLINIKPGDELFVYNEWLEVVYKIFKIIEGPVVAQHQYLGETEYIVGEMPDGSIEQILTSSIGISGVWGIKTKQHKTYSMPRSA